MKKNPELHELLAVDKRLAETANRVQKETSKILEQKRDIFSGLVKSHEIFDDEKKQALEKVNDIKEVESTVSEHLQFAGKRLADYWNVILQKDYSNQTAKANIMIGDNILVANVPSTTLLSLEKKLESLISMYNVIPTLDAAKAWGQDTDYAIPNVWRTVNPRETQHRVVYKAYEEVSPATVQHKAQVVEVEREEIVGKYTQFDYSGAITSLDKSQKLERLTTLIMAVQTARQRANTNEVDPTLKLGETLINFINNG